ncbi:MAG: MATE family efflux transporter [Firmicutes bacterium]|nr:MATE family efflux transporter [Bacillota bacterium]
MCNGPILKKMLIFAVPLMCSSMLQLLFNAADIIVVGKFAGDVALAAVGSNTSLVLLLSNLFIGLSVGVNVLAARYFGAQKGNELSKTVHTAILLSIVSGVMLTIIGVTLAKPLLQIMDTPDAVINLAALYLRIYFLGMPAMLLYNFGSAILRAKGDTRRPLIYLSIAGILNVSLNLVLVAIFDFGVAGVGIATAMSQFVSASLILRCLSKEKGGFRFSVKKLKIHKDKFIAILQIGLPAGIQSTLFSLSNVLIQASINSFGDVAMAGSAAAGNIEGFVYVAMNAFYQAAITFTSQNVGAGKYHRVKPILIRAMVCVTVTGLLLGNLAYGFGNVLLLFYTTSPAVVAEGIRRLSYVGVWYFICGIMEVLVGVLRGLGYSIVPMIVSLIGACGLRILWIMTIFQIPMFHNLDIIFLSYPVTWTITVVAHFICYLVIMRKLKEKIARAKELSNCIDKAV